MQWKPLSDETVFDVFSPILIPLSICCAIVFIPFILIVLAVVKIGDIKRRYWGPTHEWQPWYAWRPVKAEEEHAGPRSARWVWLELVDRKCRFDHIHYRLPLLLENYLE